jgi:hypothetical protein
MSPKLISEYTQTHTLADAAAASGLMSFTYEELVNPHHHVRALTNFYVS